MFSVGEEEAWLGLGVLGLFLSVTWNSVLYQHNLTLAVRSFLGRPNMERCQRTPEMVEHVDLRPKSRAAPQQPVGTTLDSSGMV